MRAHASQLAAVALAALAGWSCDGDGVPPLAGPGEPCEAHEGCASGLCLGEAGASTCVSPCADEDECPAGEACRLVVVAREEAEAVEPACLPEVEGGSLLFDPCVADEDCRTGLCVEGRCTELCESCGRDALCEVRGVRRHGRALSLSTCVHRVAAPDLVLGPLEVSEAGSEELAVEVPAGLASFSIVLRRLSSEEEVRVGFLSLVSPDGTQLVDFDAFGAELNPAAVPYPDACSVLVPSSDHEVVAPQAGRYLLRAGLFAIEGSDFVPVAGTVDEVLVVFEPEGEQGGHLDMELFFSPATGITAAGAAENGTVRGMLERVQAYYGPGGLVRLGDVGYHDLSADYDVVESGTEAREICRAESLPGPRGASVNVFVVADIAFSGSDAAGFTGGAPGPAGVESTAGSGIVVELQSDGPRTGMVLAHELGHFLGLRHTTLFRYLSDGTYEVLGEDGISDTPFCEPGMAVRDCPDFRNLMFAFFPFEELSLTAGQLWVVARSPLLYEVHRPDACEPSGGAYDLTETRAGAGDSSALQDRSAGSCGGRGSPDRMHLYRLRDAGGLAALDVRVLAGGFAPLVVVRRGGCGEDAEELACVAGAAGVEVVASVSAPIADDYYVVVDGAGGTGGAFSIQVEERAE